MYGNIEMVIRSQHCKNLRETVMMSVTTSVLFMLHNSLWCQLYTAKFVVLSSQSLFLSISSPFLFFFSPVSLLSLLPSFLFSSVLSLSPFYLPPSLSEHSQVSFILRSGMCCIIIKMTELIGLS